MSATGRVLPVTGPSEPQSSAHDAGSNFCQAIDVPSPQRAKRHNGSVDDVQHLTNLIGWRQPVKPHGHPHTNHVKALEEPLQDDHLEA